MVGGLKVQDVAEMKRYIQEHPVDIAVLALPAAHAQETLKRLYEGGVRAVWNFAPTDLNHPNDMIVVNVHLSDSLQILSYRIAHLDEK